jgi:mono/diheme cytochrome c family protein
VGGAPAAGASVGGAAAGAAARPLNRANGEKIYKAACVPCHGEAGVGGHGGGPSLVAGQTADKIISLTASGKNNMPAFAATYSVDDLRDVADYITGKLAASPSSR